MTLSTTSNIGRHHRPKALGMVCASLLACVALDARADILIERLAPNSLPDTNFDFGRGWVVLNDQTFLSAHAIDVAVTGPLQSGHQNITVGGYADSSFNCNAVNKPPGWVFPQGCARQRKTLAVRVDVFGAPVSTYAELFTYPDSPSALGFSPNAMIGAANGDVYLAGRMIHLDLTKKSVVNDGFVLKVKADGTRDTTFGGPEIPGGVFIKNRGSTTLTGITFNPADGSLVVVGTDVLLPGQALFARISLSGHLDFVHTAGADSNATSANVAADAAHGRFLIASSIAQQNPVGFTVALGSNLNIDGTYGFGGVGGGFSVTDQIFNPPKDIRIDAQSRAYMAGVAQLARITPAGTLDTTFGPAHTGVVTFGDAGGLSISVNPTNNFVSCLGSGDGVGHDQLVTFDASGGLIRTHSYSVPAWPTNVKFSAVATEPGGYMVAVAGTSDGQQ